MRYLAQAGTMVRTFDSYDEAATWLETGERRRVFRNEIREVRSPGKMGEPDWNDIGDPRVRDEERQERAGQLDLEGF